MNKSQKTIVGVVGVIAILFVGITIHLNFRQSNPTTTESKSSSLLFDVPKSEITDLESVSKFDHYQRIIPEDLKKEEDVTNFGRNVQSKNENIDSLLQILKESYGEYDDEYTSTSEVSDFDEQNQVDYELLDQNNTSIANPNQYTENYDSSYNQNIQLDDLLNSLKVTESKEEDEISTNQEKIEIEVVEVSNEYETNLDSLIQNSFYGKNNSSEFSTTSKEYNKNEFIQAEFYRNTVVKQNDIIEIRLLENVIVFENFIIPKGTVLYGIATISPRRLFVRLNTNIYKKRSITKSLLVYDYDGREGVYLKEQKLYKIPAEITQELTEIIKSQYSQPSFGGVNNNVELEEIALITSADKIYKQINQLSVNVKGGYKLWIKI